jgi:hypothetical protein
MTAAKVTARLLPALCAALVGCGQFEVDTGEVTRKLVGTKHEIRTVPGRGLLVEAFAVPGGRIGRFRADDKGEVAVDLEPFLEHGYRGKALEIHFLIHCRDRSRLTRKYRLSPEQLKELHRKGAMFIGSCNLPHRLQASAYYAEKNGILSRGQSDMLRIEVRNYGPGEAYRVRGTLTSDLPGLRSMEIPFGALKKGQTKTWEVEIRVGPDWKKGYHKIRIAFTSHKKTTPRAVETSVFIE